MSFELVLRQILVVCFKNCCW